MAKIYYVILCYQRNKIKTILASKMGAILKNSIYAIFYFLYNFIVDASFDCHQM